jgi:hypothetical protein
LKVGGYKTLCWEPGELEWWRPYAAMIADLMDGRAKGQS